MSERPLVYLISPIIRVDGFRTDAHFEALNHLALKLEHSYLKDGSSTMEYGFYETASFKELLDACKAAKKAGADAIVLDCLVDPCIRPLREFFLMNVLGALGMSVCVAQNLGSRVGIIFPHEDAFVMTREKLSMYNRVASDFPMAATDQQVHGLQRNPDETDELLLKAARRLIEESHADVILLGCAGYLGFSKRLRENLLSIAHDVPVVDPIALTLEVAASLVRLDLAHSRKCYRSVHDRSSSSEFIDTLVGERI